ncbi:HAAS signaling domain-containing protein [Catellatospora citrea]|uniref:DUF1700 domain-containing protein n=1 Tax=Catellatospora citrea TaxID=53366 RepID=A0A8J3NY85_9ACTN|nr:hypothetical protein [Catellatospora citrea]RKE11311.1 hypothetical protein C8E86_6235 [Catellatospora citrea]GIF96778.1 hypothetical protein Cci01nite_18720 [Catellatospora citrea]
MTGNNSAVQRLISDYLQQVREATVKLSPGPRAELLTQLEDHIRDARHELNDDDVDGTRAILRSLGTPAQIAAAAFNEPDANPSERTDTGKRYDLATVLLLSVGALCLPVVGWVAGVFMLWNGPRWSLGDKLLGTLVWPLGPSGLMMAGVFLPVGTSVVVCTPDAQAICTTDSEAPSWLGYLAVGPFLPVVVLVSTAIVCVYLARRARRFDRTPA